QTISSINNLSPGIYSVTVSDSCSASVISSCTIADPPPLSATCGGVNISCHGAGNGTVSVTANGGSTAYSYLWSNGATTSTISNLTVNIYAVTVSNICGTTSCSYSIT